MGIYDNKPYWCDDLISSNLLFEATLSFINLCIKPNIKASRQIWSGFSGRIWFCSILGTNRKIYFTYKPRPCISIMGDFWKLKKIDCFFQYLWNSQILFFKWTCLWSSFTCWNFAKIVLKTANQIFLMLILRLYVNKFVFWRIIASRLRKDALLRVLDLNIGFSQFFYDV